MIEVLLLMGGLFSADGPLTSAGMLQLKPALESKDVKVTNYLWGDFNSYCQHARSVRGRLVVIGYSGGGMSATFLASPKYCKGVKIDLLIVYDPSPSWNMQNVGRNVKRSICYCNTQKMWVPPLYIGNRAIGGGKLVAPNLTVVTINENHLAVQYDQSLHSRTIREVKALATAK